MIGQVIFLSMNFMQNYLDKNNPSKLQKKKSRLHNAFKYSNACIGNN